ncbi:hypothetical protein, partial [Enterobacter hormaechei]|uniref:hypothetical protein n=1 Tax=Enterobacter hormaechei TaxID=158836 RepID=UPI00387E3843
AFAFGTSVGPVSVSATGLFAHAGQRICLWNLCRPGKRQRHRAFCRVALRLPGLHCAYGLYGSEP